MHHPANDNEWPHRGLTSWLALILSILLGAAVVLLGISAP